MPKRILSALLALILVLGLAPCYGVPVAQAAEERTSVRLDFKETARSLARQDFWSALLSSQHEDIKYAGSATYKQAMSDEAAQAYADLQSWLGENANWQIDESLSGLSNIWYWKTLYFNAARDIPWGLCFRPYFHGADRSDLILTVTVPEGGAGVYRLEMDIFRENTNSKNYLVSSNPGGGKLDVYVNDQLVYEHYDFAGGSRALENLGMVQLQDGENTIRLHSAAGFTGTTETSERCSYDLCAMEFIPLQGALIGPGRETAVDLRSSYLPFDATLDSTCSAVSSDDGILTASFDESGMLVLCGVTEGTAQVEVFQNGASLLTLPVTVSADAPLAQDALYYLLGGAKSAALSVGGTAQGDLTCLTTQLTTMTEEQLRQEALVYFESSDARIVTVDQESGNVTAVGEGTATVTAYCELGGSVSSAQVAVTVTDETDLSALSVSYSRSYMGTGQSVSLQLSGTNASGAAADLEQYEILWSVDDESLASVSDTGRLTAIAPGAVTITAACGEIVGSFTMQIVENARMPGTDYRYEFFHGKGLVLEQGSLAQDGIAINEALTNCTIDLGTAHGIAVTPCYPDMQVALDFYVPKSGFYAANCFGTTYSWGGLADVYMDDVYMGQMDFNQNRSYSYNAPGPLNTVWLDAGIHTIRLINVRSGYFYWGGFELQQTEDPGQIVPVLTAKTVLLVGETTEISFGTDFFLKQVDTVPSDYTNYCILSSGSDILTLDGTTVTAAKEGSATITLQGEIAGRAVSAQLPITVVDGSVHTAALSAEATTLAPTDKGIQLQLTCFGTDGSAVSLPSGASVSYESADTALATVDQKGFVTITGEEGSARITAVITEGSRTVECAIWITVTAGKTEPTVYTYEERANALENVSKYAWAASEKNTAVSKADFVVEHLDTYYEAITHEGLPRSGRVGENGDPEVLVCRYCKVDLGAIYNHYPYIVDPINKPWKITCPECDRDFPSNDFESYYKSGLDEQGYFHPENADPQYLINELYPEMGEGWGVDDGFGYDTGNVYDNGVKEVHYYIAYYLGNFYFPLNASAAPYSLINALKYLRDAYLYTGDAVYGNAGAILLDRLGDVYPEMNYHDNSVSGDRGKIMDYIFEGSTIQQVFATCADAFWDCFDNAEVVEYLRSRHTRKGITDPDTITPETIREHIDENILLTIRHAIENGQSHGNTGMSEAAMAYAAVALDRLPESKQMIDWIFRKGEVINVNTSTGEQLWTGGSVMHDLVSKVDRDGFGNEGAITYNRMWYQNYLKLADALSGYTRVQGADLWKNPKFLDLFIAMDKITVLGNWAILTGEAGHMQGQGYYPEVSALLELFANTTDDQTAHAQAARILYTANGRKVDDLHGSIFTKDPESGIRDEILAIVSEQGEYNASESNMLCGHGLAILRNGPEQLLNGTNNHQFSDFWMYFGLNGGGHGAHENLSLGIDAYGLSFTGSTGYPTVVNTYSPDREHWMRRTLSHNTVMVNHASQLAISKNSFPLHFDDAGEVKLMDVDASHAYAETDIYRRTVVTVALENQQYYAVDFFRVLGGRDHVYSFHAHTMQTPETEGLSLVHQPMGTYAGADVPLGASYPNPYSTQVAPNVNPYGVSTAASWLDNVYRDSSPDGEFVIDFAIEDFADRATTPDGLGMQLRVLSREPLTEVAIADGHPSQNGLNPEYVKYALLRRSGGNDLDSLFTAVIEPYCTSRRVTDCCLVNVLLLDGEEDLTDTAAAVKVTRADGREDFIVYATNPDCLYAVCEEDGTEKFRFQGFAGVCSYEDSLLVYAYGNEAVQVADVIEGALPKVTGKVTDFTEGLADTYSMTVSLDQTVTADKLEDHYIYVENDGEENGVYRIHGAQVSGTEAVLDLHTQSLARSYADEENMALGFVHNIEVGQSFTIPQSAEEIPSYCEHKNTVSTIAYNGDKTHTVTKACTCGVVISETISDCADEDKDTKCDRCGGVIVTLEQVNISGSNMTLGNDLKLNFMIKASTMGEGPYTVRVTQDGKEPVLLSPAKYNSSYYYVPYTVAAKEMADVLTAEVLDANGYVISKTYTRSVTAYAVSLLGGSTTKESLKKVVVDMLNYGTEAQKYFGYNEDTYANATVTDAQQEAYATKEVTGEDTRVKGTNFYGSNLSLETSILMNIFFRNIDQADLPSLTAACTYTDYKGRTVTQDCTVEGYGKTMCKVVVDRIVLADSRCMVTVSLYKDGAQIGYGAESVESYVARSMGSTATGALNTAILKFADSAYAHLGGTYHD